MRAMLQEAEKRWDQDQGSVERDCELGADDYDLGVGWQGYMKITMFQLQEKFRAAQAKRNESRECQFMLVQLDSLKIAAILPVTILVALGIGTLHREERTRPEKSFLQLAALLTIRASLSGNSSPRPCQSTVLILPLPPDSKDTVPCFIQNPSYSELEKSFLPSLNLKVVDDPDAFSCIDAGSLVFNIGTYMDLAWWISIGIWPAAMITNDWGNPDSVFCDRMPLFCCRRVRSMFDHYNHEPFIHTDRDEEAWGNWTRVNMYWQTRTAGTL